MVMGIGKTCLNFECDFLLFNNLSYVTKWMKVSDTKVLHLTQVRLPGKLF